MSRARDLSKLGNPNIIKADENSVGFGTQVAGNHANADSSLISAGIVTATAFYGDGSNLEGVASAGLGTAVDDTKDSIGQNIYFTNQELSINENTTVNAPDTSSIAYTQYQQVTVESGSELIIADGDSFIPDVLGIGTAIQPSNITANGNGLFGTVYTDNIENAAGRGGPNFPLGMTVSGVSTFSGNVSIGGTLTYEDVTNVDSIGIVTARNGIKVTGGGIDVTAGGINVAAGGGDISLAGNLTNVTTSATDAAINIYKAVGDNADKAILRVGYDESLSFKVWRTRADANIYIESSQSNSNIVINSNNGGSTGERLRIGAAGQIGLSGANYGTSGQVLTSQGNSAAPQWATPSGGSWEVVSTHVLSGSDSTLDFNNWTNAYQKYQLVFSDIYCNHSQFHIYLRIFKDATSGNTGTLMTQSNGYASNASNQDVTASGIGAAWSGWVGYHKLANNNHSPLWHGTYDFYMGQPVSTPSGNNECSWFGHTVRERNFGMDCCMYAQDKDKYLTGVRVYFIDAADGSSAMTPNGGRFTLYRMKYS